MIKYLRMGLIAGPSLLIKFRKIQKMEKNLDKYSFEERHNYVFNLLQDVNKKAFHIEYIVSKDAELPKQAIYFGNHVSVLDPLIPLFTVSPNFGFLAKKETLKMPFVAKIATVLDSSYIDRKDLRSEIKVFINVNKLLKKYPDLNYCIFPEGTRSKKNNFNLLPFHPGSFKIATKASLPIVPMAIYFTDRILNQRYHYKKYPVQVHYLKPIYPSEYENLSPQNLAGLVEKRISDALDELKKNDLNCIQKVNNYSLKKAKKVQYR